MPFVRCPACDEEMEIEADWYGRRVACPSCDKQFVARRPGEAEDDEEDARSRRRTRAWEDDDEEDDRPLRKKKHRPERPMPMGRGTKQLILTAAIVGPILLMCLGCGGWLAYLIFAPVSYPEPWVAHALPDQSYSVRFPQVPTTADPVGGFGISGTGTKWILEEPGTADSACAFGYIDNAVEPFDQWFQEDVRGIQREIGVSASSPKAVTAAGLSGKEVEFKVGPTKVVYRLFDASDGRQKRFILVMAGGRNLSEADRNKFLDSLKRGP